MIWTKATIDQDNAIYSDGIVAFIMKGVPNMDFMIGETPVTQALWTSIMGTNPSEGPTDPYLPVCNVSYPMVKEFIGRLNEATGAFFRLPSAYEWEMAAKCGDKNYPYMYPGTDDFASLETGRAPVKKHAPNEIGLYCLTGNVMEWTGTIIKIPENRDELTRNLFGLKPKVEPIYKEERILKGGSSKHGKYTSHIKDNNHYPEDYRNDLTGFRLVMDKIC